MTNMDQVLPGHDPFEKHEPPSKLLLLLEGRMDINKLWQNFLDTVTNHYFDLNGRVGIAQFWYFVLVEVVIA